MAEARRYYSDDDIERGVTPSALRRMGRDRQKEYMRHWFHRNFEDPAQETHYDRSEGGYIYLWGGPYDAHDELYNEFGALIPEERIQELAREIEGESGGIYDWAPGPDHPDTRQREEDWRQEYADQAPDQESLEQVIERLRAGAKPRYGDGYEIEQRRAIRAALEQLRSVLVPVTPLHGGIGHNRPPPDNDSPQVLTIIEIRDAEQTISRELAKSEPNALEVANATSRLQTAFGWLGRKIDKAADSFASLDFHGPELS